MWGRIRRRLSATAQASSPDPLAGGPSADESREVTGDHVDALAAYRVVVVTRAGCHLCDEVEAVVKRVAEGLGVSWTTRDVDADPQLHARWSDSVPVTFVDGRPHDFYRVSESRLRAALER